MNIPCILCGLRKPSAQMTPAALKGTGRHLGYICRECSGLKKPPKVKKPQA